MSLMQAPVPGVTHRIVDVGGLRMHIAEAGSGPLVLLLHGFPECWYSWRHQLTALAGAGYHVVAPDQRGYGETDCPREIEAYTQRELVADIVTVSEEEMLEAIRQLAFKARLVAEPGGAAAVAACLFRDPGELGAGTDQPAGDGAPVVAVLSGGNIDPKLLAAVLSAEPESYTK